MSLHAGVGQVVIACVLCVGVVVHACVWLSMYPYCFVVLHECLFVVLFVSFCIMTCYLCVLFCSLIVV